MRVLMTCGGTGGHINPAIAIANTIKKNDSDAEIAFVGTKRGKESELLPRAGYHLYYVKIQGIRRSLSPMNIITAWYILTAPKHARELIEEFKPDIVIGTGGYVCWPSLKAAASLGIPTMVHESNALPGLAVKKLRNKVDRILINFEKTRNMLKMSEEDKRRKIIRVGNPLRNGFGGISQRDARTKLNMGYKYFVMSVGGSLGAQGINNAALSLMHEIAEHRPDILYMHAAGVRYYDEMKEVLLKTGLDRKPNIQLCDYIHDMPLRMAAADIVISRAGAITISELALMGKPAILIPSPNVVDNHQYKNAKVLFDAGAAVLLEEVELDHNDYKYAALVLELLGDAERRQELSKNIERFADKDANKLIYTEIQKLLCEKDKNNK